MQLELNHCYQGHVLDVLKQMPSESVDMCITSPPYYGLRAYGTEPQVWDGVDGCQHEWSDEVPRPINLQAGNPEFKREWGEQATDKKATQGCFCSKCGAWKGELGLEPTFELYIKHLIDIFDEVRRVLKPSGTCWVNIADSYSGTGDKGNCRDPKYANGRNGQAVAVNHKTSVQAKSQCGIPERFMLQMMDHGWIKRNTIIWYKPNAMPASVKDRFTIDFEPMFFFTKNGKYYFEQQLEEAVKIHAQKSYHRVNNPKYDDVPDERYKDQFDGRVWGKDGLRNKRTVWTVWPIPTKPYKEAHFATFPEQLVEQCILAGCPKGGVVLDLFMGSGTTASVAIKLDRNFVGIELKLEYIKLQDKRIVETCEKLLKELA